MYNFIDNDFQMDKEFQYVQEKFLAGFHFFSYDIKDLKKTVSEQRFS